MINKENILRTRKFGDTEKKISINLKVNKEISDYLKEKNISPTALFLEAIKELKEN